MRVYIIALILMVLGLSAIAYKGSLPADNWQAPYLHEFSSALLVGGLLSVLFKLFQDKHSEEELRRLMRIHDSVDELGLCEIKAESQGYNFTEIIENSHELAIVINDGLRWVGNNTVALQTRFGKKCTTEVFTVDPDSAFVDCLSAKVSGTKEELQKKIHDTWKRLEETYNNSEKKGKLKIYRLKTYPTRSMFVTENMLVETPYQIASGRANVPAFVYHKVARHDSLYGFAKHDLDSLRKESSLEKEYGEKAQMVTEQAA